MYSDQMSPYFGSTQYLEFFINIIFFANVSNSPEFTKIINLIGLHCKLQSEFLKTFKNGVPSGY